MMKKIQYTKWISVLLLGITVLATGCSNASAGQESEFVTEISSKDVPIATIEIEGMGTIQAELYPAIAPNTVNNFIHLANNGYYDGLTFHRVIKDFMIQGGDPNGTGTGGPGYAIAGEFKNNGYEDNNLAHTPGVLSMARSQAPDSAGSQFFIMTGDSPHLDGDYAAFGKVVGGIEVANEINVLRTDRNDKPEQMVIIKSIVVDTKGIEYPEPEKLTK
ncbi:MAG: peptidylprolyl isomerase [Cellulosilyticaceae bacterium]